MKYLNFRNKVLLDHPVQRGAPRAGVLPLSGGLLELRPLPALHGDVQVRNGILLYPMHEGSLALSAQREFLMLPKGL